MAANSALNINKDTGTDILMSGISVILPERGDWKCYTTARETGEQTVQDPWLSHLDFMKALSQSYMVYNHSRDRLEENGQACSMMVSYVYFSKIWYEVVPSSREIWVNNLRRHAGQVG